MWKIITPWWAFLKNGKRHFKFLKVIYLLTSKMWEKSTRNTWMKKLWIVTTSNQKSHNTSKTGLLLILQWKLNFMNFVSKDSISNSLQYNKYLIMKPNSIFCPSSIPKRFLTNLLIWQIYQRYKEDLCFKFDYDLSNISTNTTCYDFNTNLFKLYIFEIYLLMMHLFLYILWDSALCYISVISTDSKGCHLIYPKLNDSASDYPTSLDKLLC